MEGGHCEPSRLVKLFHFDDIKMSFYSAKDWAQQYQMLRLLNGLPSCTCLPQQKVRQRWEMFKSDWESTCVFWAQCPQLIWWDYTSRMERFPTPWLTSDVLFWERQREGKSELQVGEGKGGRDRRMIEWGRCRRKERQSGDGKWQYNMIWFVEQNGFSVPIFSERTGEQGEGGLGRQ